ncbi:MAG: glycoside-pentoside-hexuronide (GPH):cation symporter [Oscillospiraceae bacterium]|nr:glycoside-pentoside-hexuronide (GPH):cation symporter [Oscillospiraceae bacterium]
MDDLKLRKKNLIMFPLGTVGRDMVYNLVTNFLLTFILFTRGLTAAQLGAVTAIMVGARIFDALNDPIMGNIIERTRTKWGKFKPWLVIGILTTSVVVISVFNISLQGWDFIWFFGFFYFMYSITYTMHDISYWGMIPALSSDADARNRFTSRATLFAGIGGTIATVLIPMLTTGEYAIGGSASIAYGRIAVVICILAPLFLCFTIFGVHERRDYMNEAAPPISLKKVFRTISGNDQLLWISLIFLVQQVGNGLVVGGIGSTYIYFEFGYKGGLYSIFTTVGMSATAFLMIFYPAISRRIHRKKLMGIMAVISTAGYLMMLVPGLLMSATMAKFWIIVVGYMLSNFGQYCFYLVMMISIINTVEYNELREGTRDEAIITSLRPFLTKMGSAITVALTSACYLIFGVTNYTNQISSLENQAAAGAITESEKLSSISAVLSGLHGSQALGLLLFMTVLPCALMLVSHVMYKKHYKLDEEEYDRICAEIEARKAVDKT